jgi:uncharacterized membrane protein HdeD (DUF308 family)
MAAGVFRTEFESMLSRTGRAWIWIFTFGLLTAAFGVVALVWPASTVLVIAILFAAQLVVGSVFQFVAAFAIPGESGWLRALTALLAIISFALGIFLLGHVILSVLLLALLLGVYWIMHGIVQLFIAVGHGDLPGRGWTLAGAILSIATGVITVVVPGISLLALTIVLGAWLVVYGVVLVGSAIRLRSIAHAVGARRTPRFAP